MQVPPDSVPTVTDSFVNMSFVEILGALGKLFLVTLGFTLMGLLAFGLAFLLIVKFTPFSIRKELEEDQNIAFGIVIASVILGVAMVVSAAVQG